MGAKSFLIEWTPFQKGTKANLTEKKITKKQQKNRKLFHELFLNADKRRFVIK